MDAALARLHHRFPGATIWHGSHTRQWWALLPGHPRLLEAATPQALERLITAVLGTRHHHGWNPRTREQPGGQSPQGRDPRTRAQSTRDREPSPRDRYTHDRYTHERPGEGLGEGWVRVPRRPARPPRPGEPPARPTGSTTTSTTTSRSAAVPVRPIQPRHRRRRTPAPS
ncbi:hypothetical protein GCM10022402_49030 [Salinactinospora qingdaonensis]|uniref:Uncharacterized protein n=1 Tax=Salinactinospora qingdaonensis TaxID=702744 RepID=A0ABP7GJ99_9ACTN